MKKKILVVLLLSSASIGVFAQSTPVNLKTQTGNEIGLTVSSYSYSEPSRSVSMKATNLGIDYTGTYTFGNDWFLLGNANYNNGPVNYSAPGAQSEIPQYYYDLKAVVGYDFGFNGFNLSPYVGIGYRFLSQQWGGTRTSTGAGYDRQNTLHYLPIGVTHRFAVGQKGKIETTAEYDLLLSGNQYSGFAVLNGMDGLSDIPNVNNSQSSGYGLNLTVMYKEDNWGMGPYWKYWNIQQSNTVTGNFAYDGDRNYIGSAYEPANNTNEYGVKAIYRF